MSTPFEWDLRKEQAFDRKQKELRAERDMLKRQRDELLEACKHIEGSLHGLVNGGKATSMGMTLGQMKKELRELRDYSGLIIAKAEE